MPVHMTVALRRHGMRGGRRGSLTNPKRKRGCAAFLASRFGLASLLPF